MLCTLVVSRSFKNLQEEGEEPIGRCMITTLQHPFWLEKVRIMPIFVMGRKKRSCQINEAFLKFQA